MKNWNIPSHRVLLILGFIFTSLVATASPPLIKNPLILKALVYKPKAVYFVDEPVWVEYFIYNTSDDTVWVSPMVLCGNGNTTFEITTGRRNTILFATGWDQDRKHYAKENSGNTQFWKLYCLRINPMDTVYGFYDLTMNVPISKPGTYHLKKMAFESFAREGNGVPTFPPFWKGRLEATVDFVINTRAPLGNEKTVRAMFRDADKKWSIDRFAQLIKSYPNSVYAPKAQINIIYLTKRQVPAGKYSEEDLQKEIDKLTASYPDYPYSLYYKNSKIFMQD
ncbi:MAG: hypothetical protein PHX21_12275 [bacterium]|nr:hypothetical protein [bacterium]